MGAKHVLSQHLLLTSTVYHVWLIVLDAQMPWNAKHVTWTTQESHVKAAQMAFIVLQGLFLQLVFRISVAMVSSSIMSNAMIITQLVEMVAPLTVNSKMDMFVEVLTVSNLLIKLRTKSTQLELFWNSDIFTLKLPILTALSVLLLSMEHNLKVLGLFPIMQIFLMLEYCLTIVHCFPRKLLLLNSNLIVKLETLNMLVSMISKIKLFYKGISSASPSKNLMIYLFDFYLITSN